jgi:hypothetical protein
MDPYVVTRMIIETCCSALAIGSEVDGRVAAAAE